MSFLFYDLDDETRGFMKDELEKDRARGAVYLSRRLSDRGRSEWPDLLLEAVEAGSEETLAAQLATGGRLVAKEPRVRNGKTSMANVPRTAHQTLAEGEFNRFYIRAVCRGAIKAGQQEVVVYRAKPVNNPRSSSAALEGSRMSASALLDDLQTHIGEEPSLKLPGGPNSGLSVKLA